MAEFRFFCVLGRFGGPGHLCFFGDPTTAKNPKKSGLGPRRGRFRQIIRGPKILRTVFPQPMSQKNPDFEPLSMSYVENTGLRARRWWGVCLLPCGLSRFWPKSQRNRGWGPVEAVSAKFSGDLIVARGDFATDEPKNPDFEPLSPSYVKNTGSRARWHWGLCLGT